MSKLGYLTKSFVKLSLHVTEDLLLYLDDRLQKINTNYFVVNTSIDGMYFGSKLFNDNDLAIFVSFDPIYVSILRRCGYRHVCMVKHCQCGLNLFCDSREKTVKQLEDIVKQGIYYIDETLNYRKFTSRRSGFGTYVRDLVRQAVIVKRKEGFNGVIEIVGCESESVVQFQFDEDIKPIRLSGLPTYEEDEFILWIGENTITDSTVDVRTGLPPEMRGDILGLKYGLDYTYFVYELVNEYQIEIAPKRMTPEDSYIKYKVYYPEPFDHMSISYGFKYSTWLEWVDVMKDIFSEGLTMTDIGSGFLLKFMMDAGIEVVVNDKINFVKDEKLKTEIKFGVNVKNIMLDPIWCTDLDLYEKRLSKQVAKQRYRGYRCKWLIAPIAFLSDAWITVVNGHGMKLMLYRMSFAPVFNVNMVHLEYERREFRSLIARYYIARQDMFDVVTSGMIVALFSISNIQNITKYFNGIKRWRERGLQFILMFPSREFMEVKLDGQSREYVNQHLIIREGEWRDFCISNSEAVLLGDYYSILDFELMIHPVVYRPTRALIFNMHTAKVNQWGILTNIFDNISRQGYYNSSTIRVKSVSTLLARLFRMTQDELHLMRVEYLKDRWMQSNLEFLGGSRYWSLCRYPRYGSDKEYHYVDVSGHILNFVLMSCWIPVNFRGYIRQVIYNYSHLDYSGRVTYEDKDVEFNDFDVSNVSLKGLKIEGSIVKHETLPEFRNLGLWHTKQEFADGFEAANYISQKLELMGYNDIIDMMNHFMKCIKLMPKQVLSIPVLHDIELDELYREKNLKRSLE